VPRIVEMLVDLHSHTVYAGLCDVSREVAHRTLRALVGRNGDTNDGGSLVMVEEDAGGVVQGFIIGLLARIYFICDRLEANDMFLHLTDAAPPGALMRLVRAYLAWADANPRVVDVNLSWSDATPDGERLAALYRREGLHRSGEKFTRPRKAALVGALAA
jgi:hypothetical protein